MGRRGGGGGGGKGGRIMGIYIRCNCVSQIDIIEGHPKEAHAHSLIIVNYSGDSNPTYFYGKQPSEYGVQKWGLFVQRMIVYGR